MTTKTGSKKRAGTKRAPTPPRRAAPARTTPAGPTGTKGTPSPAATKPARARARSTKRKPATRSGALEATYSTVHFRSRLEARYAIFFDLLEWDWTYEPSLYHVGPGLGYVPDFWLPRLHHPDGNGAGLWAEVKGAPYLDRESMAKMAAAVGGADPIPLRDPPYRATPALILLGNLPPAPTVGERPTHTVIIPSATPGTAHLTTGAFTETGLTITGTPWRNVDASGIPAARRPHRNIINTMLNPPPVTGDIPARVMNAYLIAATVQFDTDGAANIPHPVRALLSHRRAGRPARASGTYHTV